MEPRTVPDKPAWVSIWLPLGLGLVMGLTGVFIILCSLAGCGDGRQASLARPELSYNGAVPFPAVVGESIVLTPAASGKLDHYHVSPSLPVGLSIDELSGVISGTPTKPSRAATYVVSAAGAGVRVSFPLVVSVTEPPSGLSYASPVNATVGVALAPLRPTITGPVERYTVSPALPTGIVLGGIDGVISGTPTEAKDLAPYTITASSLAGTTRFVLLLTVMAVPVGRHLPAVPQSPDMDAKTTAGSNGMIDTVLHQDAASAGASDVDGFHSSRRRLRLPGSALSNARPPLVRALLPLQLVPTRVGRVVRAECTHRDIGR